MKNKDRFPSYESARSTYDNGVVPTYGTTRMDWGFGRWLWLDYNADGLDYWKSMDEIGILTQDGRKRLARALRDAAKEAAR